MSWSVSKDFTFDAAHRLPGHDGHCSALHGHTYRVRLTLEDESLHQDGPMRGMVCDFGAIKNAWKPISDTLDHGCLNEVPGLENPTAENIAAYIYRAVSPTIVQLVEVQVWETPTSSATYRP